MKKMYKLLTISFAIFFNSLVLVQANSLKEKVDQIHHAIEQQIQEGKIQRQNVVVAIDKYIETKKTSLEVYNILKYLRNKIERGISFWTIETKKYTLTKEETRGNQKNYKICIKEKSICAIAIEKNQTLKEYLTENNKAHNQIQSDGILEGSNGQRGKYHDNKGTLYIGTSKNQILIIRDGYNNDFKKNNDNIEEMINTIILDKNDHETIQETAQKIPQQQILLYYYNIEEDKKIADYIPCDEKAVIAIKRNIYKTKTPIKETLSLLIKGELTEEEKANGFQTAFPHNDFIIESLNLKNDILYIKVPHIPGFTSGGSCHTNLLYQSIKKTALQFPQVKEIKFTDPNIFQS